MIKKLLIMIMVLILSTGCAEKSAVIEEKVLTYLEEKYDDSFEIVDLRSLVTLSNIYVYLNSEKYPNSRVMVYYDKKGKKIIDDDYADLLLKDETVVSSLIEQVYGKHIINFQGRSSIPLEFDETTDVEKSLVGTNYVILFDVYVGSDEATRDEDLQKMASIFEENGCYVSMTIYYTSAENITNLDLETIDNISKDEKLFRGHLFMDGETGINQMEEWWDWN